MERSWCYHCRWISVGGWSLINRLKRTVETITGNWRYPHICMNLPAPPEFASYTTLQPRAGTSCRLHTLSTRSSRRNERLLLTGSKQNCCFHSIHLQPQPFYFALGLSVLVNHLQVACIYVDWSAGVINLFEIFDLHLPFHNNSTYKWRQFI